MDVMHPAPEAADERAAAEQVEAAMAAERETLSPDCRADPARLAAFLAEDFHGFGASGREITREGIAEAFAADTRPDEPRITVTGMRGSLVAGGVVMVKYTASHRGRRTHRTSLWRCLPTGRWVMFHHQGTLIPGDD